MDDDGILQSEVDQLRHEARRIAAGGWRRAVLGFAVGALAGFAAALVLPSRGDEEPAAPAREGS